MDVSRYVVLKIKSARLYRSIDGKYKNPRNIRNTMWVEPITKYQVYNVLATLCGERTVSSVNRRMKTKGLGKDYIKNNIDKPHFTYDFSDNPYFMDWANSCLLNTNRNNNLVVRENVRTNKGQTSSKVKFNALVTWEDFVWYFMGKNSKNTIEDLKYFKEFMKKEFDIDMDNGVFIDDLEKIYSTPKFIKFNDMASKYISQQTFFGGLVGYICQKEKDRLDTKDDVFVYKKDGKETKYFTKYGINTDIVPGKFGDFKVFDEDSRFTKINTKGISQKTENISGVILVPIRVQDGEDGLDFTELKDYKMLSKGPGISTILDGGCVVIDRVIMPYHIDDISKYDMVGDVSLEEADYK